MRIPEGWSSAGWYVVYALLCVRAHPMKDRASEMRISGTRLSDSETAATGYGYEDVSASKSSKIAEDSLEELEEERRPTLRAITTKTRSNAILLPLIIEPEAEMLPPGYKGVKPPGVSHMELMFVQPQAGLSGRKSTALRESTTGNGNPDKSRGFGRNDDAHYAASRHETQIARDDQSSDSIVVSEAGVTDGLKNESEYDESSGTRKSYSKNEDRARIHADGIVEREGAIYENGDDHKKAHNAAGYRNVYRKDGFNKDADFYDNGRQDGRLEKHGRYGERQAAAEGTYEEGKSNDSSLIEQEINKRKFKKARDSRAAQGHATMDTSGTWTDS